ncbi:NUDIX domain-containing protein [Lactobacillus helveticus]|nr:NUDIX domain-containing protein [Lactobacillus helveticus]MBW8038078.1 NUDIX domain-containing protein [Lactobacillus helveticus]
MKLERSAGAVIYRRREDGQLEFLIVQNVINDNWGFPKGHLENDEDAQEAAKREVFEEVGLKPKFDFNFVRKTHYALTDTKFKTVTFFLAKYVPGQEVVTQKEEILADKWVTFDAAKEYLTEHGKMGVLTAAKDYIEK